MASNIGNLKVTIGADTKNLVRGIGRAKGALQGFARLAKVTGAAAGAAFAAASVGIAAMTKSGLAAVDAQAKMARSVDGSIDGLRALQLAGGDAGASVDQVNNAVQQMGKRLAEAAREGTGPAADALKVLGLNARDLMRLDVDERIGAIADRVNEMGMSAQDAAGIMREFGVRNNEIALILLQGSEAIRRARSEVERFGISIGEDAAAQVERANDAMSRISLVFEGMRAKLAIGMAPVLEKLAVNFQGMAQAGGPLQGVVDALVASFTRLAKTFTDPAFLEAAALFGTTIAGAVAGLADLMVTLSQNAEIAGAAMIALGGAMAFFSGPIGLAVAAIAGGVFLLSTRLGENETAADDAAEAERELMTAIDGVDRANGDAVAGARTRIENHISQARAALEAARAEYELKRAQASRDVEQARMRKEMNPGNFFADDEIDQALENQALLDQHYEEMIAKRQAQVDRYGKILEGFEMSRFPSRGTRSGSGGTPPPGAPGDGPGSDPLGAGDLSKSLQRLLDRIAPAERKARDYAEALALLKKAHEEGVITAEELKLRTEQLNKAYEDTPQKTGSAASALKALRAEQARAARENEKFANDINGSIANLINRIEDGADAVKAFAVELVKLFAIRGISKLLGGTDWFSGDLFIPGNAQGTDNWRGGLSWVGERGPELVNLPRGAQVIPNNKLHHLGGGGMQFTYAPKIDARGASVAAVQELDQRMRADAAQFNSKVEAAVQRAKSSRRL